MQLEGTSLLITYYVVGSVDVVATSNIRISLVVHTIPANNIEYNGPSLLLTYYYMYVFPSMLITYHVCICSSM